MSTTDGGDPTCTFHPTRTTLVGCTRCDRPMCPDCLRDAPVGRHCVECIGAENKRYASTPAAKRLRRPGMLFYVLVAAFVGLCVALTQFRLPEDENIPSSLRAVAFGTAVVGWIITLCFHEWAHAFTAYKFGDTSVVDKGYLTLDPRKYTDPMMSVALPILFLLMGGIGLPGGAVWVDHSKIPHRYQRSLVSLAGPMMNVGFGILGVLASRLVQHLATGSGHEGLILLATSLAYFSWIQFATAILNLLPVPGLDGFGILAPWLPVSIRQSLQQVSGIAIMIFFVIVFTRPGTLSFIFDGSMQLVQALGQSEPMVILGYFVGSVQLR